MEVRIDTRQATDSLREAFSFLTRKEYGKAVYFAMNETLRKGKRMLGDVTKSQYPNLKITRNVINKGLPIEKASSSKWRGTISVSKEKIKFKHWSFTQTKKRRGKKGTNGAGGIVIEINRGEKKLVRNAFVGKKASLNGHIFSRGNYLGNKFVPDNKNKKLSTMLGLGLNNTFYGLGRPSLVHVQKTIEKEYPRRLTRILKSMSDGSFAKASRKTNKF